MKILIFGSEGFIGSHLVSFFKTRGAEVFSADIVLKQELNYFLINPEIPDFAFIFRSQPFPFDVCINASGAANVQLSFAHPALDFSLNAFNVYNILEALRQKNPRCKFINLSSAAVYGNPAQLPVKETDGIGPVSPYGYHKWYSELICRQFHQLYGMPALNVRIFSAYGEGLKKQLFWDVYQKALAVKGKTDNSIRLFGTGNETRDFIHVTDICSALDKIVGHAQFVGEVINVASGIEIRVKDAVILFIKELGYKIQIDFGGEVKKGDPLHWRADISNVKKFGFEPGISIESGIERIAQWMKNLK